MRGKPWVCVSPSAYLLTCSSTGKRRKPYDDDGSPNEDDVDPSPSPSHPKRRKAPLSQPP